MSISIEAHWNTKEVMAVVQACGEKGIRAGLNFLLDESRKQVPLDTGALMRSGAVDSHRFEGSISYDTPYAVRQHECMTYHHQRGRKAKYLSDPVNDGGNQAAILQHMQASMNF